jgi:hypothetical protein
MRKRGETFPAPHAGNGSRNSKWTVGLVLSLSGKVDDANTRLKNTAEAGQAAQWQSAYLTRERKGRNMQLRHQQTCVSMQPHFG